MGGVSRLDQRCLVIGLIALLAYALTRNGLLAISFGILSDFIGYIPTFVKTWHKPDSEDPMYFIIESIASLLAVFAIWDLRLDIIFPIYFVGSSVGVVLFIYRKKLTQRIGSVFKAEQHP